MTRSAMLCGQKNDSFGIQQLVIENEEILTEKYGISRRRYLEAAFLDNRYLIEIIRVYAVVKHSDICRYTEVTDCAFMAVDGKSVLTVELREKRSESELVTVVIAEVRLEGKRMLLGFIVDQVENFYKMIL